MSRKMAREPKALSTNSTLELPGNEGDTSTPGHSKIEQVLALLRRETGASVSELTDATGWLPHSTRAVLTGLRKKGHLIDREKRDGISCYRIASAS